MDSLSNQQLLRKDETVVQADAVLEDKKVVAFYFSAHWCPPCRMFTPILAEFYSVCYIILKDDIYTFKCKKLIIVQLRIGD